MCQVLFFELISSFLLHRLLAIVFIPNPNTYEVVDHIDGNTKNNKLENLQWCTQKQNVQKGKAGILQQSAEVTRLKKRECDRKYYLRKKLENGGKAPW